MSDENFSKNYTDAGFWDKVQNFAKDAGEGLLERALKMYYSATDDDTPLWAKTTIYGALGYFISPIDAVPDIVPVLGYSDDLTMIAAALAATAAHIKDEHVTRAKETLKQWFS